MPVIVPRVSGVHVLLESFEPIHGVLLCEGEDIDPSLYDAELTGFSPEELKKLGNYTQVILPLIERKTPLN